MPRPAASCLSVSLSLCLRSLSSDLSPWFSSDPTWSSAWSSSSSSAGGEITVQWASQTALIHWDVLQDQVVPDIEISTPTPTPTIISDPATLHSGSNNGSFVSDSAGSVISRPRRQAVARGRNKKKRNRNNNRKGGGRNIRKSSKRGGASQNKINKASKKCLNTGMNWRSYQSSVVISK